MEADRATSERDKINYLKKFMILDKEIKRKIEEISDWRGRLERITALYSDETKGGGSIYDHKESLMAKIIDLENEVNADIYKLVDIRNAIVQAIESVENDKERLLLEYRYLDGKTFEAIADEMNYNWRWIHRIHKRSIEKIQISH